MRNFLILLVTMIAVRSVEATSALFLNWNINVQNTSPTTAYNQATCGTLTLSTTPSSQTYNIFGGSAQIPPSTTTNSTYSGGGVYFALGLTAGQVVPIYLRGVQIDSYTMPSSTGNYYYTVSQNVQVDGSTCALTSTYVPPSVYTNYVLTAYNSSVGNMNATWTFNGSIVKQQVLKPGQSASWTTPSIKVSPPPADTWTANVTQTPSDSVIGYGDTGGLYFTNDPQQGVSISGTGGTATTTTSGGGTVTNSNGTISFGGTGTGALVISNNIVWATPSGSASESTLEGGFSVLHKDNVDQLNALKILNQDEDTQLMTLTNQLGQVATYMRSNSDATWQLLRATTNMNAWWFTNGLIAGTNQGYAFTNFATEDTLRKIGTNLQIMVNAVTNRATNDYEAQMWANLPTTATNEGAATTAVESKFSVALGYLGDAITSLGGTIDVGGDPGHSSIWEFNFCGQLVDLDPVNRFPTCFTFSFGLWNFVLVAIYLFYVAKVYVQVVNVMATAQTGGVPNLDVFSLWTGIATLGGYFGGNLIGLLVAVVVPAAFIALWFVVVTVVIGPLTDYLAIFHGISGVFATVNSTPTGQAAMHVLFNCFPVASAIQLLTAALIIKLTAAKAMLVSSAASRYLFGK